MTSFEQFWTARLAPLFKGDAPGHEFRGNQYSGGGGGGGDAAARGRADRGVEPKAAATAISANDLGEHYGRTAASTAEHTDASTYHSRMYAELRDAGYPGRADAHDLAAGLHQRAATAHLAADRATTSRVREEQRSKANALSTQARAASWKTTSSK